MATDSNRRSGVPTGRSLHLQILDYQVGPARLVGATEPGRGITQKMAILAIYIKENLNQATLSGGQVRNCLPKTLGISRNIAFGPPGISRNGSRPAQAKLAAGRITQQLAILTE